MTLVTGDADRAAAQVVAMAFNTICCGVFELLLVQTAVLVDGVAGGLWPVLPPVLGL